MNENQEQKPDMIQDALRRVNDPEPLVDVDSLPTEGEQFGPSTQAPTGSIPGSAFSMMQNMQSRLGDKYQNDPNPQNPPTSEPQSDSGDATNEATLCPFPSAAPPSNYHPAEQPPIKTRVPKEWSMRGIMDVLDEMDKEERKVGIPILSTDLAEGTSTNNAPTFPNASSTRSLRAIETCIPESAEDKNLRGLLEFVKGNTFSADWVRQTLNVMERSSPMLPVSTQWRIPFGADLSKGVYDTILTEGYVERHFSSLEIVMTTSIDNPEWCASVLCLFALFNVLEILGPVHEQLKMLGDER